MFAWTIGHRNKCINHTNWREWIVKRIPRHNLGKKEQATEESKDNEDIADRKNLKIMTTWLIRQEDVNNIVDAIYVKCEQCYSWFKVGFL